MTINPYLLFGLSSRSTIKDLRKAYYEFSLCCHPDKGGNTLEMNIVHKAYLYIKEQLENCRQEKTYEELEQDFEDFCKTQETTKSPSFRDIYDSCNDFALEFNKRFEKNTESNFKNPFDEGYSKLMEQSENVVLDYPQKDENKPITKDFGQQLISYKEPNYLPDSYGDNFQLNNDKINDFSHKLKSISLTDYVKAFSEIHSENVDKNHQMFNKSLDDLVNERNILEKELQKYNIENTPLLTGLQNKRNDSATRIQKHIRRIIAKKNYNVKLKLSLCDKHNIPFEKYITILQKKWKNRKK